MLAEATVIPWQAVVMMAVGVLGMVALVTGRWPWTGIININHHHHYNDEEEDN